MQSFAVGNPITPRTITPMAITPRMVVESVAYASKQPYDVQEEEQEIENLLHAFTLMLLSVESM